MTSIRPISELLVEKREEAGTKAAAIRALGISRQMYDGWEGGIYRPGDEYIPVLAQWLNRPMWEIAIRLVHERAKRAGVYIDPAELSQAPVAQVATTRQYVPTFRAA